MSKTCACSGGHTITLSDDGVVYSFGEHNVQLEQEMGLNSESYFLFPNPSLPKIKQVACGTNFTFCVDEGFVWTFSDDLSGQYGMKETGQEILLPQKIEDMIPLALSVACGLTHVLIITIDSDVWSCGDNSQGQLCFGHQNSFFEKFLQTLQYFKYFTWWMSFINSK